MRTEIPGALVVFTNRHAPCVCCQPVPLGRVIYICFQCGHLVLCLPSMRLRSIWEVGGAPSAMQLVGCQGSLSTHHLSQLCGKVLMCWPTTNQPQLPMWCCMFPFYPPTLWGMVSGGCFTHSASANSMQVSSFSLSSSGGHVVCSACCAKN